MQHWFINALAVKTGFSLRASEMTSHVAIGQKREIQKLSLTSDMLSGSTMKEAQIWPVDEEDPLGATCLLRFVSRKLISVISRR